MRGVRRARIFAALVAVLVTAGFLAPVTASAGTLTSASFTTNGSAYALTSAKNTTYNYGFTTATPSTLSRASATVPPGTNTYGTRYLALPGTTGNYASTPNSAANTITGALDVRLQARLDNWSPSSDVRLIGKWGSTSSDSPGSYELGLISGGQLDFAITPDGNIPNQIFFFSSTTAPFANGVTGWVRTTYTPDNGSGVAVATFYTSTDGTNWTQLGVPATRNSVTPIGASSTPLTVGYTDPSIGGFGKWSGRFYYADLRNSIGAITSSPSTCASSNVVQCFNPADDGVNGSGWNSSSATSETWQSTGPVQTCLRTSLLI